MRWITLIAQEIVHAGDAYVRCYEPQKADQMDVDRAGNQLKTIHRPVSSRKIQAKEKGLTDLNKLVKPFDR